MATFSVNDVNNRSRYLEFTLMTWGSYHPAFQIAIREGATTGFNNQALIPIYMAENLIKNLNDPISNALVQNNNKIGNYTVGRRGNDFVLQISGGNNPNVNELVMTLNEGQWRDTIRYVTTIANHASLIKEIATSVRMNVQNLLRSVGIDIKEGNRFKTTPWWDDNSQKNGVKPFAQEVAEYVVKMMGGAAPMSMNTSTPFTPTSTPMNMTPSPMPSMGNPMPQPPMGNPMPPMGTMPPLPTNNGDNPFSAVVGDTFGSDLL